MMIRLEPLTGHHDRSGFDCGVEVLNVWLKQTALQHQSKGISRTFVAVPHDNRAVDAYRSEVYEGVGPASILGFYALASAFVLIEQLPPSGRSVTRARSQSRVLAAWRLGWTCTGRGLDGFCWRMPSTGLAVRHKQSAVPASSWMPRMT